MMSDEQGDAIVKSVTPTSVLSRSNLCRVGAMVVALILLMVMVMDDLVQRLQS